LQTLWLWHASEETEHRSVSFDIYLAMGGNEAWRRRWMITVTVFFSAIFCVKPATTFGMTAASSSSALGAVHGAICLPKKACSPVLMQLGKRISVQTSTPLSMTINCRASGCKHTLRLSKPLVSPPENFY